MATDPATTCVWQMDVNLSFEADNPEDAQAIATRIVALVMEHPSVWAAVGDPNTEQEPEVVDVA